MIVDLDGVVWVGASAVPGSASAIERLRAAGVQLLFCTNDPTGSRADYASRLADMGIHASTEEILSAGSVLAAYVRHREGAARVFVIGSASLRQEVVDAGLTITDGKDVDAVIVGGHPGFCYEELRIAAQAVRGGARLYAAGRDATFPMPDGPWPATGAILAAVEIAAGQRAVVTGKPEPHMFEMARSRLSGCHRIAIVGDNLEADIAGGRRAGLTTILVMTGATTADELRAASPGPDMVFPDLVGLVDRLVLDGTQR